MGALAPLIPFAPAAKYWRGLLSGLALLCGLPLAAQAVPTTGGAAFHGAAGVPAPICLRTGYITPQIAQRACTGPNPAGSPAFTVMTWVRPHGTQLNWSSLFKFGSDPSVWGMYFIPRTARLRFNFMTPSGNGPVNTAALGMNSWRRVTLTSGPAGLDVYLNSSRVLSSPDRLAAAPGSVYLTGNDFPSANALLGDFGLWNTVLSHAQVAALANPPPPVTGSPGLATAACGWFGPDKTTRAPAGPIHRGRRCSRPRARALRCHRRAGR